MYKLKKFLSDTSGNFAMMTAFAIIPIVISAGVAIDFMTLHNKREKVQAAIDAAGLSVASSLQSLSQTELEQRVSNLVQVNIGENLFSEITPPSVTVGTDLESVVISTDGLHIPLFVQLAGISELPYNLLSEVETSIGSVEVVLALDTTRSMQDEGKLQGLQAASHSFLTTVLEENDPNRIKIGIVPFAQYINVGEENRDADWLSVPDDEEVTLTRFVEGAEIECSDEEVTEDGVTFTRNVCQGPTEQYTDIRSWGGCVGSREEPLNITDDTYTTPIPGRIFGGCANKIIPLTNDLAELRNTIDKFVAQGQTYIPGGLIWGLRVLSSQEPFSEGKTAQQIAATNTIKALVVMTDGENQKSIDTNIPINHTFDDIDYANTLTLQLCQLIKSNNIRLFTIGFGNSIPQSALDIMQQCASNNGDDYFEAANAATLEEAFTDIASRLIEPTITR